MAKTTKMAKKKQKKPDNEPVVISITRDELLKAGALVDVTKRAKDAGFRVPVALTRAAWERHVVAPGADDDQQDVRLWDVLWMAFMASSGVTPSSRSGPRITYPVISAANVGGKLRKAVETKLDLVVEGSAITIALRGED